MTYYLLFGVIWFFSVVVFISFMAGAKKLNDKALISKSNNSNR